MINLIQRASNFADRTAITTTDNDKEDSSSSSSSYTSYTYSQLLYRSKNVATHLLNQAANVNDLQEDRIAFLIPSSFDYVAVQWGIWRAGGIVVPLCDKHPLPSIQYVLDNARVSTLVYDDLYSTLLSPLLDSGGSTDSSSSSSGITFINYSTIQQPKSTTNITLPTTIHLDRRAMILYTSGTTGKPKGVVTTHKNIESQIKTLISKWKWNQDDHILNILPLHHVHGILNITCCCLWIGACCEFLPKGSRFHPQVIFDIFCIGHVNVFMAVPTIYYKLITYYNTLTNQQQQQQQQTIITNHLQKFRLMVSGSAALPISVLHEWKKISGGHVLLERYGMTEMGMAISNPYDVKLRMAGFIGQPLDGVLIRLVDDENHIIVPGGTNTDTDAEPRPGEIQIKGPNVFKEYWDNPKATKEAFTSDGWFKSGDIAIFDNNVAGGGSYRILGRNSIDIIKSGGYKISALEIEEVLRTHDQIKDCGVVGIPDLEWGEIVGASIVLKKVGEEGEGGSDDQQYQQLPTGEEIVSWLREKLPAYKIPRRYIFQDDLPRNVMGKVTKNDIKKIFTE